MDVALSGKARGAARRLMRRKTTVLAELSASVGASVGGARAARSWRSRRSVATSLAYQLADDAADEWRTVQPTERRGRRPCARRAPAAPRGTHAARLPALSGDGVELLEGWPTSSSGGWSA